MVNRIIIGVAVAVAAVLVAPPTLQAQVPAVLVCEDGSTQPGPTREACKDYGGVDWTTTNVWAKMRAGKYAATDTVVCMNGQAAAAGTNACARHGGVDSVSTLAAVKRRAKAGRYASPERASATADTAAADSTRWGYHTDSTPEVQNPPGYRGMERPVGVSRPDSGADSAAAADATSRVNQARRQGSSETDPEKNPPGYRGMERPAGLDSVRGDSTAVQ